MTTVLVIYIIGLVICMFFGGISAFVDYTEYDVYGQETAKERIRGSLRVMFLSPIWPALLAKVIYRGVYFAFDIPRKDKNV